MFHVNNNGEPGKCSASVPEKCPFYVDASDPRHYSTIEEATKMGETLLEKENNDFLSGPPAVTYSFLKSFKKEEEKFEQDFEGFPTRFFNADLRGKFLSHNIEIDEILTPGNESKMFFSSMGLTSRLLQCSSSPQDLKTPSSKIEEMAQNLGLKNIQSFTSGSTEPRVDGILRAFKAERLFVGELNGETVLVFDSSQGEITRRLFRYGKPDFIKTNTFTVMSVRDLAGAHRLNAKTGDNLINVPNLKTLDAKRKALIALKNLENSQLEGRNFISQRKYVKESGKKVATAYMDKKNIPQTHLDAAANSRLRKNFRHLELDADVDLDEFKDFEDSYIEIKDKLPEIPKDKTPELRIRKLGKHKAHGVFFPQKNTVAVDVHNSGSFIHEMGHQFDLVVKNNASLNSEFSPIIREYVNNLKIPHDSGKKIDYYSTPTEVFARFFENYAHEKLGINNRLVDVAKFDNFDHAPIRNNPELKAKAYAFFDKIIAEK